MSVTMEQFKQVLIDHKENLKSLKKPTTDDEFESEIRTILDELKTGPHAGTKEYKAILNDLRDIVEIRNAYANSHKSLDMNVIVPLLIKAGFSLAAVIFWISLEQGRTAPNNLVRWTTGLLTVR